MATTRAASKPSRSMISSAVSTAWPSSDPDPELVKPNRTWPSLLRGGDGPVDGPGPVDHVHDLGPLAVVGEAAVLAEQGLEAVQPVQQPAGAGRAADGAATDLDPDRAGVGEHHRAEHRGVPGAAGDRAQPQRVPGLDGGVDRQLDRSPAGPGAPIVPGRGLSQGPVGPGQLQALHPEPPAADA